LALSLFILCLLTPKITLSAQTTKTHALDTSSVCQQTGKTVWLKQHKGIELFSPEDISLAHIHYKTPLILLDDSNPKTDTVLLHGWFNPSFEEWKIIDTHTVKLPWRGGPLKANPNNSLVPKTLAIMQDDVIVPFITQFKINNDDYFELCLIGHLAKNSIAESLDIIEALDHKRWLATFATVTGKIKQRSGNDITFSGIKYEESRHDKKNPIITVLTFGINHIVSPSTVKHSLTYMPLIMDQSIKIQLPFNKMSHLKLFACPKNKSLHCASIAMKSGNIYTGQINIPKDTSAQLILVSDDQAITLPLQAKVSIMLD
jgi:hypothetical protein